MKRLLAAASFLPSYLWRKLTSSFSYYCFNDYDCATPQRMDAVASSWASACSCPSRTASTRLI